MKTKVALLFLTLATCISCDKDDDEGILLRPCSGGCAPVDYRCAFVGDYEFEVVNFNWISGSSPIYDTVETSYQGTILAHITQANTMEIRYRDGVNTMGCENFGAIIDPTIDTNGQLSYLEQLFPCSSNASFFPPDGQNGTQPFIANDTIRFHISSGGKGGQHGQIVVGVKK